MIRKLTAMLLVLMLAVVTPLCALAATQYTVTVTPGDDLASLPGVGDLLNVLAIKLTTGEKGGALTLTLSDTDIVTIAAGADANGLYLNTPLVSDSTLYTSWDDLFSVLPQLLAASMQQTGAEVSQETLNELTASMDQYKALIVNAFANPKAEKATVQKDPEALKAQVAEMFKNDPGMVDYMNAIIDRCVIENGEFTAEGRDKADTKTSVVMTAEDLINITNTDYMRTTIVSVVKQENGSLSGDALNAEVEKVLEEVREVYRNSEYQMTMSAYSAGEEIVGMDLDMKMVIKDGETSHTVLMTGKYDRLTGEAGKTHNFDLTMDAAGETALVSFVAAETASGNDGMVAFLAGGNEIAIPFTSVKEGDVTNTQVSLYYRTGATAILPPAASDRALAILNVKAAPDASGIAAVVDNATPETSLNVLRMGAEEMQALVADVSNRAMPILFQALSKLPPSVLQLLNIGQ